MANGSDYGTPMLAGWYMSGVQASVYVYTILPAGRCKTVDLTAFPTTTTTSAPVKGWLYICHELWEWLPSIPQFLL